MKQSQAALVSMARYICLVYKYTAEPIALCIDIMRPVTSAKRLAVTLWGFARTDEMDSLRLDTLVSVTYKRFSDILRTWPNQI